MAKKSKFENAIASLDAKLGTLRDIATFLDAHPQNPLATVEADIEKLQYARNLLTGASSEPTEAKPKRTRKKRGMPLATAKTEEPTL